MINLEWLRTFQAIFECNKITEASERLHMTQPGVSKHLSALEGHIGKKLFERTTRRLTPTEYGRFLYAQIKNPLEELQKIEYYSGQRAKKKREAISIGCTHDFYQKELRQKIFGFDMYIVTVFGNEKELIGALESDQVQLLVGIKKHSIHNHVFTPFKKQELQLACSKKITIPNINQTDDDQFIQWLQKQTWFTFDNDQGDLKAFWKKNFTATPKIVPRYILPSYRAILEALKISPGFSVLPSDILHEALTNDNIQLPLKPSSKTEQQLYFSYKPKNSHLNNIVSFIKKLEKQPALDE